MGQWVSRLQTGSDSFFTGVDGKLGRLEDQRKLLEARKENQQRVWRSLKARFLALFVSVYVCILAYAGWVIQQPQGTFTSAQHAVRISPVFVSPALAYIWYQLMAVVCRALIKLTDKRIHTCQAKTEKIIHGLKDAMRYDRTHALLSKYDPDYNDGLTELKRRPGGEPRQVADANLRMSLPKKMTAVAASTMGGAGMRLSGALAQLWSVTADTVIGDDPVLLNSLRVAESQAQVLEHENIELKKKIERYEEQFGLLYDVSLDNDDDEVPPKKMHDSDDARIEDRPHIPLEEDDDEVEEEEEAPVVVEEEEQKEEEVPRRRTRRSRR